MSENTEHQAFLAKNGAKTLNIGDFMHAVAVGMEVFLAIQNVAAGQAGNITVSYKGKKYDVTVTPQG
jgi:hypothetical protein